MLQKMKSKKGFTLAELLVVVAVIAILIAVAVPLFITALNKAREGTFKANYRSAKAAAVMAILNDTDFDYDTVFGGAGARTAAYFDVACDKDTGDLGAVSQNSGASAEDKTWKEWQDDETITVKIELSDITLS